MVVFNFYLLGIVVLTLALHLMPGWWLTRRWSLPPAERVLAGAVLSAGVVFGSVLIIYWLHWPPIWALAPVGVGVCLTLWTCLRLPDLRPDRSLIWLWLTASLLALTLQTRVVAHELPDWWEHWRRAVMFSHQLPLTTKFGGWSLAARGPLFNAFASLVMTLARNDQYFIFQVICTVLNTFPVVVLACLLQRWARCRPAAAVGIALGVGVLQPFLYANASLTWTKLHAAGLLLTALLLYRQSLSQQRWTEAAWALALLGLGMLTHYYVVLYAAFLVGDFAVRCVRMPRLIQIAIVPAVVGALPIVVWFGLLIQHLGWTTTMSANSTNNDDWRAKRRDGTPVPFSTVYWSNHVANLVPRPWLAAAGADPEIYAKLQFVLRHFDGAGRSVDREEEFPSIYFRNGIYGVGLNVGLALLMLALVTGWACRGSDSSASERWFWWIFVGVGYFVHVWPVKWFMPLGTFSQNLQPMVYLAIVMIVRQSQHWPIGLRRLLLLWALLESAWVTLNLQAYAEERPPLRIELLPNRETQTTALLPCSVRAGSISHLELKVKGDAMYLADLLQRELTVATVLMLGMATVSGLMLTRSVVKAPAAAPEPPSGRPIRR